MNPEELLALTEGTVEGWQYHHWTEDLGELPLPSGRLEACDPFTSLGNGGEFSVPPGTYPVKVTLVDVSEEQDRSHVRESYLSLIIADGVTERVEYLVPEGRKRPRGAHEFIGVPVGAGTVAFAEFGAAARAMPDPQSWLEDIFDNDREDSWFALMDAPEHYRAGAARVDMPLATQGEVVVLCHSGWGDGVYPVLGAYDAQGTLLSVHIDLQVEEKTEGVEVKPTAQAADAVVPTTSVPTASKPSWRDRLLGKK